MSLRVRLLAAFAYALLIVIVALMVPLATNLSDRVNAEVRADSAAQAQIAAASIADRLGRPARVAEFTEQTAERLGARVFILDGRGRLLADSEDVVPAGTFYATDEHPPLLGALRGEIAQGTHPPDLEDLSTAVPIVRNARTIGALEIEQSLAEVNDEVRSDVLALIGVAALALALGLGVAWILAGSISRPIKGLASAARRMAGGELSARAEESGSSEQVDVARAFNEMAERLEAVLESQRSFVADASHQLRTPLTGMRLRLEAAADKAGAGSETAREIEAAEQETERLSAVVGDLLALASSEEPAEPQRADLRAAASATVARWEDAAADAGHGILATGDGAIEVSASERDLAVMLDNLVENALKYSPRGSTVEIGWGLNADGSAALRVRNEGGSLGDEDLRRAFERFYRGSGGSGRRGTGLGLAIVGALAKRAGGSARLLNAAEGGGVVAEVTLPRAGGFADS